MEIQVDKKYRARDGSEWRVMVTNGRPAAPVTATRWAGKRFENRSFQLDGHFWADHTPSRFDLLEEVA